MAGDGITFNDKKVKGFFSRIAKNVKEIQDKDKAFWGALTAIAFRDVIGHFNKELGPKGKWKKWSSIYAEQMQRTGKSGNKILQDSGILRQNLFQASSSFRIKSGQLLYNPAKTKSGFAYAEAHNEGGDQLPQREFMWLSNKALNKMSKIMAHHTVKDI